MLRPLAGSVCASSVKTLQFKDADLSEKSVKELARLFKNVESFVLKSSVAGECLL